MGSAALLAHTRIQQFAPSTMSCAGAYHQAIVVFCLKLGVEPTLPSVSFRPCLSSFHGFSDRVLLYACLALFPQFFSLADDMTTAPSRLPVPSLLQCSTAIPHHPLGRKERRAAADALQTAVFSALRRTAEARSPSSPPSRRRRILSASVGQEGHSSNPISCAPSPESKRLGQIQYEW